MTKEFEDNFDRDPFDFPVSDTWRQHLEGQRLEYRMELLKNEILTIQEELAGVQAEVKSLKKWCQGLQGGKICGFECVSPHK